MSSHILHEIKNKQQAKPGVKELVLKYSIYLPLLVVSISIAVAVCYVYLKYQSPVYSSSISVYFPESAKGGSQGADVSAISEVLLFDQRVNLNNEIQVLKSKSLMLRVAERLNLGVQYFRKGRTKMLEMYKSPNIHAQILSIKDSMLADRIVLLKENGQLWHVEGEKKSKIGQQTVLAGNNIKARVEVKPEFLAEGDQLFIDWVPLPWVGNGLLNSFNVVQMAHNTNILNFTINTEVPEKGQEVLNMLAMEYNLRSNEQKDRLVDYTLQFIDERVELMRGELGKVETDIQRLRQAEVLSPEATSSMGMDELTSGREKIQQSEVKLEVIRMVKQASANPNTMIPSLGIDDAGVGSLIGEYNTLLVKKEEQLRSMPAANPIVRNTQAQLDKLRSSISASLDNLASNTRKERSRASGEIYTGRSKLVSVPRQERQLMEIGRQQDIKEKLFVFLLEKKEEAAITKASNLSANAIPIDPAATIGQVSPNAKGIYQKGIFIAILIPVLFIYLRELLNDKVTTRSDITSKTNTPIIGEILHSADKKRRLVVSFDDRSVLGEQFRMVRANLPFITKSKNKQTVLITSTTSGEGKTFCSLNLGAVYAVAGKRTVILEMDLRKPKVTEALNIPASMKGITHYVSDQATLEELPISVPGMDNLYIITAGIIPPNPSEILMDEKIEQLFAYLKEHFDFVVIDSAPLGLVSDAKVLGKHADATIYVVRQRKTAKKQVAAINELYEENVFPNLTVLVNDVKAKGSSSYYGYGGNYMSNYKYSYGTEEKSIWQRAKAAIAKKETV